MQVVILWSQYDIISTAVSMLFSSEATLRKRRCLLPRYYIALYSQLRFTYLYRFFFQSKFFQYFYCIQILLKLNILVRLMCHRRLSRPK